jgi:hypothetical protein
MMTAQVIKIKTRKRNRKLNALEQIQKERHRQKMWGMRRHRKTWENIAMRYLDYYDFMWGHKKLARQLAKEFAGGGWLLAHEEGLSTNQWLWRESRRALRLGNIQPWTTVPYEVPELDI